MCLSVNNCCCCITLNVGAKIIAAISTLSALASLLLYGSSALVSQLPPGRLMFYASMALTSLVQTVFGCLLLYGVFARKPSYTWPWTALAWCQALTLLVLAAVGTVLLHYNRKLETTAEISAVISVYFFYALVLFYFSSVVNSRRQQMGIEERSQAAERLMRHRVLPNYYV